MVRPIGFACLILLSLALTGTAESDTFKTNAQHCIGSSDDDRTISACTWLLDSGRMSESSKPIAFNNRGLAYYNKGQHDRAIADFDEAIRLRPDYPLAYSNRGNAYDEKGQYDRAIQDYDEAIRQRPDFAEAYFNRAYVRENKRQYERAIADYSEAIRLNPDYADAYGNRGMVYLATGNRAAAIRDLRRQYDLGSRPDWLVNELKELGALD